MIYISYSEVNVTVWQEVQRGAPKGVWVRTEI